MVSRRRHFVAAMLGTNQHPARRAARGSVPTLGWVVDIDRGSGVDRLGWQTKSEISRSIVTSKRAPAIG